MLKIIFICLMLMFCAAGSFAQTAAKIPAAFKSDGCSMFPDGNYRACCVEHDKSYFKGGTWRERRRADNKLFNCVASQRKFYNKLVAPVMWLGVRVGGAAFLPTSFRWGFGKIKKSVKPAENQNQSKYE